MNNPPVSAHKKNNSGNILRNIILIIAICLFVYSTYKLTDIYLEYKKGTDIYNNIDSSVLDNNNPDALVITDDNGDTTTAEIPFTYNHAALLSINPEGLGYIYIPSIDTRLPIAQATDNDYYLTHAFEGTYNGNGCIFEDYRIEDKLNSSNIILYGHNMKNGSMFGQLSKYQDYSFWNTPGNDIFYIYTEDNIMMYRIFSAYISEPVSDTYTFNFSSKDSLRQYAADMKANSLYPTDVDITQTTQVVTLSTCTKDGSRRFIIHGTYVGKMALNTDIY